MSKNTNISELINYLAYDGSGNIVFTTVSSAATNTDKFLVSDSGTLKFRTAAQLLSDIGAQASGSYQAALSGTGFVKISGSTISYDNSTYATQTYVGTQIANLVASSPATLDTLNELATALGNDPNFATTVATSIGTKQAQLNGTGFVKISGTTISYDNSTYLTTSSANSTYLPLAGGTLSGPLTGTTSIWNGYAINATPPSVGTAQTFVRYISAGSDWYIGSEGSVAGNFFGGASAYASVFFGTNPFQFITAGVKRFEIATGGITSTVGFTGTSATFTSQVVVASPFTIKDTNPYIQWKNSSDTRLGYIQHATNLVMSADTGNVILTTASGTLTLTSVGNFDYGGYNIQSSNNAIYRQAFWGAMSIMWRNAEDFYIDSNHTYSSSNTNVASYTSSNGIGRIGIAGGDFSWSTYNGAVNAGSAYGLTERFNIAPSGVARFSSSVQATDFRYTNTGYITYDTANTGSESLIIRKFGTPVLTLDSISRATFASTVFIGGNLHFDTNGTVRTISNYGYGGSLQLLRSDSTSTRWARIGIVDATGTNFIGGMTINNDTSATFSSNITTTGTIIINSRTVYTTAAIYDNASAGNNVGIGFGPNSILPITGDGTASNGTKDLGSSSVRWSTVYTSDLSLSNGIGDYTIVEGENDLFLYNNKQNKVYKFMLAEVDPAYATPKKS